jgi:hypothetical protein
MKWGFLEQSQGEALRAEDGLLRLQGGVLRGRAAFWLSALIPCAVLLGVGLVLFASTGRDDMHITYWPAYTLSHFGKIVNYNGEYVEQSSTMLYMLLLAAIHVVTMCPLPVLGKILSIVFGMATLIALNCMVTRMTNRVTGFAAAMMVSLSPGFLYWTFGGMEPTLVSFLGILVIMSVADYLEEPSRCSLFRPAFAMLSFELVRPEALVLLGCLLSSLFLIFGMKKLITPSFDAKTPCRRLARLLGVYLLLTMGIVGFRLWYFGLAFPQPVYAKSGGIHRKTIAMGWACVQRGLWNRSRGMMLLGAIMFLSTMVIFIKQIRIQSMDLRYVLSLLYVVGYLSFVILVGGDWMEGGRFLVPFLPIFIAMIPLALTGVTRRAWLMVLLVLATVVVETRASVSLACSGTSSGIPVSSQISAWTEFPLEKYTWFERHCSPNLRDMPVVTHLDRLVSCLVSQHKPVTIMSAQMGFVSYYTAMNHFKDVRFIDKCGLTERSFTESPIIQNGARVSGGYRIPYESIFSHLSDLKNVEDRSGPDIIFDLSNCNQDTTIENAGYTILYRQHGKLMLDSRWLRNEIKVDSFIAVRNDLVAFLPDASPIAVACPQQNILR